MASVNCPPWSYPTYPGGAPIKRDTENLSMYSLISILTIWFSLAKSCSAKDLASSVLPTPVGPKNMKDPIGLFSFLMPALCLMIASLTNSIASS